MASVQVRDVPEDVHQALRAQAAAAGQSLNEFLLGRLREIAATPSVPQLLERIRSRGPYDGPSSAEAVRAGRADR
jgi:antitoxin FitA